ncbi:MAG: PorV/PorQ family protein [Ignavibacteriales bacterium]|nr:PorV/PorQ family protein [Ignavibacteriales bacterium]MBK7979858.1 PorV/PorQ family protein [Ignavibacteriota bacterium]
MKNKIIIILILPLFAFSNIFSQEFVSNVSKRGTTAAPFLSIAQGSRSLAMGSAFVAVADDPSALYWNPAGITKVEGAGFIVDHTQWIADVKYDFIGLTYNLGSMGSIGMSFTTSNIGDMNVTTIDEPNGTGETFSASDVAFSLAWAIQLTDNFAIGFNPKFVQQSIWKMSASAIAIDMGIQYITPFDGMMLAMSISNFGTKMKLEGNSALVVYDPDASNSGNNGSIPAYLQTDEWDLPLNFRVGVAYDPIKVDNHELMIALDALHVSDNYESVNLGVEYVFNDMFALRGGYKSLFLESSEESFSLGAGIKQYLLGNVSIGFDYAYQNFGRLSNVQKFSLIITF